MAIRTVDLSGRYLISAVAADKITLDNPAALNPAWLIGDMDGAGVSTGAQNLTLVPSVGRTADLTGTYEVAAVTPDSITLVDPSGVNPDWDYVSSYNGQVTRPLSATLSLSGQSNWVGPFIVEGPNTAFLVVNVLATQGLYAADADGQYPINVPFVVEATPIDQDGTPLTAPVNYPGEVVGSNTSKDMRARTLVCALITHGRQSVRIRRTSATDYDFEGTVVDEIKVQDLYGMTAVDQPDFGNVTTVRTRTFATQGALNVKERKLNMLVTRKVPHWTGGVAFSAPVATNNAADIFVEICRDVTLGNRDVSELDLPSIHGAVAAAGTYFGDAEATQFCYTFDNDNTSFEEMAIATAGAAFSVPYRQGSKIKLFFESASASSTLLFNHRNKVPGSETRTVRFGPSADNDGVELEYTNPDDDTPATIYIPADRSASKPRRITAQGVRSRKQAYWLAWRAYNKMLYQHTTAEFTALQEAAPLVLNERIVVADNTRADTMDGDVVAQDGLLLTLSQPVDLPDPAGYTIFLQMTDGTIDAIPVTAGPDDDQVLLARAPRMALALDAALYAQTTFQLVPSTGGRSSAFLLTEKTPQDNGGFGIQAVNYTGLYYLNDGLQVWLAFNAATYEDSSPYLRDASPSGGAATTLDGTRGKFVHLGSAVSFVSFPVNPFDPPAGSYSKAAWIKLDDAAALNIIGETNGGSNEGFRVLGGRLQAGHNAGFPLDAAYPADGLWHHVAVTYDDDEGAMALFLDGELVAEGDVINRAAAPLFVFAGLAGRGDDFRLWNRALSDVDVRDLYRATKA